MNTFLKIDRDGAIVTLTMNQPDLRNALTGNTAVQEFVDACAAISADESVRAVIVTGNGKVFSSGGNIRDMQRQIGPAISPMRLRQEYREGIQRLPLALYNLDVPTIAAVNGAAIGAGCDLACMCDIRIASDRALFAESFVKVGIVPGDGGCWLLPRVVGASRAAELALTGDAIDAEEALRIGLVSRVVAPDALLDAALELAGRIAANPPQVLRWTKQLLQQARTGTLDESLDLAGVFQGQAHHTADHTEAVTAFFEKRTPVFGR